MADSDVSDDQDNSVDFSNWPWTIMHGARGIPNPVQPPAVSSLPYMIPYNDPAWQAANFMPVPSGNALSQPANNAPLTTANLMPWQGVGSAASAMPFFTAPAFNADMSASPAGPTGAMLASNTAPASANSSLQDCPPVTARILQGNARTIGKSGAFPGQIIAPDAAAVAPDQWGGKSTLRPNLNSVTGQFQGPGGASVTFNGIGDVIGGKSPTPGVNVRPALEQKNPGALIIELPGAPKDFGTMQGSVRVPKGMACPVPVKPLS